MLVGIVAANSLRISPYAFYYINLLDELKIDYEVIVPDRSPGLEGNYKGKLNIFPWHTKKNILFNYILYANNIKKIAIEKYDFLIVLTTNMGVFCYPWLKKYYYKRYILDIRDYTHENIPIFFALEKQAVSCSVLNVISSRRFRDFLPKGNYLLCHNISTPLQPSAHTFKKTEGKIIIGYIGTVAYEKQCHLLIDLIQSDPRFEFHVYGTGYAEPSLRAYAKSIGNSRIRFLGAYTPPEKANILQKVDILFNIYGCGTPLVDCALSNKLFDALYYHKPILTSPGTFMEEMGGPLAFSPNLHDRSALGQIWEWYQTLNAEQVDSFASLQYATLVEEHQKTREAVKNVLQRQA